MAKWTFRNETYTVCWPRKPVPVFIRYGLFSQRCPTSYDHSGSWYGRKEAGLSVYPAKLIDGVVHLADMEPCTSLLGQKRLAFAVTGRVVGYGSDGEPLLRGVRMLPYAIDWSVAR